MKSTMAIRFDFGGGRTARFLNKGRKRVAVGEGFVFVNADVELADGSRYDAVLELDESSSGELYGAFLFVPGYKGVGVHQRDSDFLEVLGKTKEEVFPYRYRYRPQLQCYDHHVMDDGWSAPPQPPIKPLLRDAS